MTIDGFIAAESASILNLIQLLGEQILMSMLNFVDFAPQTSFKTDFGLFIFAFDNKISSKFNLISQMVGICDARAL